MARQINDYYTLFSKPLLIYLLIRSIVHGNMENTVQSLRKPKRLEWLICTLVFIIGLCVIHYTPLERNAGLARGETGNKNRNDVRKKDRDDLPW